MTEQQYSRRQRRINRIARIIQMAALVASIIILLLASKANAQCLQDSVTDSNPSTVVTLRPSPIDPCPWCDDCDSSVFVGIPSDTGVVTFTNMISPQRDWRIKIISGCGGLVYIDTCIFNAPLFHTVVFAGDWSHGNWMMQICGGSIAYVTWKPGVVHSVAVIAPQPLPCGVLPYRELQPSEVIQGDSGPRVKQLWDMQESSYQDAPSGMILIDWKQRRKILK